jgi:hypothetical protein
MTERRAGARVEADPYGMTTKKAKANERVSRRRFGRDHGVVETSLDGVVVKQV